MVPEHRAADRNALQVERDDQVVERAAEDLAQRVDGPDRGAFARPCRSHQGRRVDAEAALDAAARHLCLDVADVAAAAQRAIRVVVDERVASVPRVAVLAEQHVATDAQAGSDACAPGDVGAIVAAAQCSPVPLGNQCGDGVVGHANHPEPLAQRPFQGGAGPVVGQSARRTGQRATQVRRRQLDIAVPTHERTGRRDADRIDALQRHAGGFAGAADHAQHLACDGAGVAGSRSGLAEAGRETLVRRKRDRDLGAADVHAGDHPAVGQ